MQNRPFFHWTIKELPTGESLLLGVESFGKSRFAPPCPQLYYIKIWKDNISDKMACSMKRGNASNKEI